MYSITNLLNYPQDGNHLTLITSLPCSISKGRDSYWYSPISGCDTSLNKETKPHLWYVEFDDYTNIRHSNGFKTPEKAFEWACKEYRTYLKRELMRLDDYMREVENNGYS